MSCLAFVLREIVLQVYLKLSKQTLFQIISYIMNHLLHNVLFPSVCDYMPKVLIQLSESLWMNAPWQKNRRLNLVVIFTFFCQKFESYLLFDVRYFISWNSHWQKISECKRPLTSTLGAIVKIDQIILLIKTYTVNTTELN